MVEDFFQERLKKNIKFYEKKTEQELETNYNHIYNNIELKDIFLAELLIIKKNIIQAKKDKENTKINFDDYISEIDELYKIIESMDDTEIQKNKTEIEMIITASKLSLNRLSYFKVDLDKLRKFNLSNELGQFIDRTKIDEPIEDDKTILIEFKREMDEEIKKKKKIIDDYNERKNTIQKQIAFFEELYWQMNSHEIDLYEFLSKCINTDLLENNEKSAFLNIVNRIIRKPNANNVQKLNYLISRILTRIKIEIRNINNSILYYEQFSNLIKRLSQCIDEKGRFIQIINNELIEQCIKQIGYSNLNMLDLQLQILKEQSRLATKQNIAHLVRTIESRTKKISKKRNVTKVNKTVEIPEKYKNILENAKKIIYMELMSSTTNDDMQLDELEAMFVEELQDKNIEESKIEQIIVKDANTDDCRIKFIVYGLNYQLENIDNTNIEHSLKIIKQYVEYYNIYKEKKQKENQKQDELKREINNISEKIQNIIETFTTESTIFKTIPEYTLKYLNAYSNVDFETLSDEERKNILKDIGYNYEFVVLYKLYIMLNDTIEELKELLDITNEEAISETNIKIIKEKFDFVQDLQQQYDKSKKLYYESLEKEIELENKEDTDSIIFYLEDSDEITYAEKRIAKDSIIHGRFSQSDINSICYLIEQLKTNSWDTIYKQLSDDVKPFDSSYKKRRIKKGEMRLTFIKIPSKVLKTEKNVYLVISIGKKLTGYSKVYEETNSLKAESLEFVEQYEKLENAPEELIQEFLEKNKKCEQRIIQCAINGKGDFDVKRK